jgi:mycofactocin precursor
MENESTLTVQADESVTDDAALETDDAGTAETVLVVEELLIEEISIDGMCGVY